MNIAFSLAFLLCLSLAASSPAHAQQKAAKPRFIIVWKLAPRLLGDANWTDADNRTIGKHFLRLKTLRDSGTVALTGRALTQDSSQFGIVIVEAADEGEARKVMEDDPAVAAGLITAQIFPFFVQLSRPLESQ